MLIDLRIFDALRRAIRRTAQIMMRQVMSRRDRLRDSKVQQADFVAARNLYVRRLDVAMHHRALSAVNLRLERMQRLKLAAHLSRNPGRELRRQALVARQNLGHALALDILHYDEEAA